MPAGRPTKYKPEYCEQLIAHMEQGFSFESFGGQIRVVRRTLYHWLDVYEDFLHAKEIGYLRALLHFEQIGQDIMNGDIKGHPTPWLFTLKCRFRDEYTEPKDELEVTKPVQINLAYTPQRRNTGDQASKDSESR